MYYASCWMGCWESKIKVTAFTFIENLFVPGPMLGVLHVPFFKYLHSAKVSIIILILYRQRSQLREVK